ncbi:arginine--tRNA ligase [Candidatus Aerophobetes bacterium]|nr:arginine--tRNA ligase [Candidatus Aerophobetes bacterium]
MDNSVKKLIENNLRQALFQIKKKGFSYHRLPPIIITQPKKKEWGDLSTNLPFSLSKISGESSLEIGRALVTHLKGSDLFSRVEFAPPGFINFFFSPSYLKETIRKIVTERKNFTRFSEGKNKLVQVEFISANPTGPLHIGHGRAAAFGDSLANVLSKVGYQVQKEYYVNDMGGQIKRLAYSLWARMQELEGKRVSFPKDGYRGDYLIPIAKKAQEELGEKIRKIKDESKIIPILTKFVVKEILKNIREDLDKFGVKFNNWFFESTLYQNNELKKTISFLKEKDFLYEKEGALWFKTSLILKGKQDRVLRRKNGDYTYFASDIAYHKDKLKRGFYRVIDIWGADHIGYVPRMKAAAEVLGYPPEALKMVIYQLVTLKKGEKRVSASTREGEFITLKEVLKEVGRDAARFFFVLRTADSHLDFDLELAKKQTPENPVFYIQYAHARICSILEKAKKMGILLEEPEKVNLDLLTTPEERDIMSYLALLPDCLKEAADSLEPHHLAVYLQELSSLFHYFYTRHRVISENKELTNARLILIQAVKIVIADVLNILGISAPSKM